MAKKNGFRGRLDRRCKQFVAHVYEHDYCAWATPYLRWCRRPLGALVLTACASLLCGLFVATPGLIVFAAVTSVIAIGCIWPWVGIRGVSCELIFASQQSEEGKPVDAELVVVNRWPWPVWGLSVEGGLNGMSEGDDEPTVAISRVGAWSRGRYRWTFTPELRGRYPSSTPKLVTEFPFGLWKASKQIKVGSSLVVWPRRFPLPPLPLPSGAQSWTGQPSESAAGSLGHRTTVREYRRGDSMRQIHWAKTALYDTLVSYEREGLAIADAIITLDTNPQLHPGSGPDSTLEWSIRIAASVGDALVRQGVGVTLIAHNSRYQADGASSTAGMLDWLALLDVSAEGSEPLAANLGRGRRLASLTVHITTDLSNSAAGDSIVLLTKTECSPEPRTCGASSGWMAVLPSRDIPQQICMGWRNGPGRLRYA